MLDGLGFRSQHLYTAQIDEIFRRNDFVLKSFYDKFLTPHKRYMNIQECISVLKATNL